MTAVAPTRGRNERDPAGDPRSLAEERTTGIA